MNMRKVASRVTKGKSGWAEDVTSVSFRHWQVDEQGMKSSRKGAKH